ncbi:reverse transcriptase domain-containing protein [Nonomuraea mesophila]|uniref:reverse transcriptase domain-containing protein n=1 Tax=Nonomuraea mesophila TaxID=2530382 RepID=UPI001FE6CC17|nr:reverse transcriptase domain-containing protein [Nonomuraea mesophila]
MRYADDGVVLCRSETQARAVLYAVEGILASLGLRLHPDKTKIVDLREGRVRTGNASRKFLQIDDYVVWRLRRLLIKKRGRNLRAGQTAQWTEEWFNGHGLHRLRGTIRYPKAA